MTSLNVLLRYADKWTTTSEHSQKLTPHLFQNYVALYIWNFIENENNEKKENFDCVSLS